MKISISKYSFRFAILIACYLLGISAGFSMQDRNCILSGAVKDETGNPLFKAVVQIESISRTEIADSAGFFCFPILASGRYKITVSHLGYKLFQKEVNVDERQPSVLSIELVNDSQQLSEVLVAGKSATQEVREQAIKSAVISTREVFNQPATLTELMNRSAGVRIRQAGGLGSAPDISVGGFQGRSIRYFKDGVPLDYLRDGYNISSVPVNSLERVEIFKGVLPVSLGADALGGAVNLVTRKTYRPELNVAYEIASFNTHRVSLNGFYTDPAKKWILGADAFYNHSDNNYKANLKVTDPETKNQRIRRVTLFHNAFTSYYAEAFAGVVNRNWADELRFTLSGFVLNREQQHPALMTDPYGAVTGRQASVIPSVRYKKSFLDDKFLIDQFAVVNTVTINRTDTLHGQYDWLGNFTPNPSRTGESRQAALSDLRFRNIISRTNFIYNLNAHNKLEINYVYTSSRRSGSDPYGTKFAGTDIDVLSIPALYNKQVVAAGLETKLFSEKLTNNLMGKFYRFSSRGIEAWAARPVEQNEQVSQSGQYWGFAEAIKYQLGEYSFARVSAEAANRLPEQEELFGDGAWVVPNFNLKPERSLNFNLGYYLSKPSRYTLEVNGFYRRTRDMILMVPTQPPYAQYMNMENVKGYGLEADLSVQFLQYFTAGGNFTWQSLRLFGLESSQDVWKNGARLRNTPYFFANASLNGKFTGLFSKTDRIQVYALYNFIREFYLETIPERVEPKGFLGLTGSADIQSDLIIPSQHLLSAGFNYQPTNRYSIGFEIKNITNTSLYDYFRIQKAGRSLHLKLSYTLKQKKTTL